MNIPTALWEVLEPKMKERIMKLRSEIRKKKEQEKNMNKARQNSLPLPSQYANKTSMQLVANLCSQLTQNDSEEDTDDDILTQSYCATTCEDEVEVEVEYKAHLEYANSCSSPSKIYAISDGGADACVVGANAYIASHTERYVHLIGCNPMSTKSSRIPIVTAYLKVKNNHGIPVLLKINEAAYNAGSPITLLSEYQIREHGYIVDSVASKHKTSLNTYGTLRIVLSDDIYLPFVDRGGLMGFEILPVEEGDIDEMHPKYDVFELTSAQKWVPA